MQTNRRSLIKGIGAGGVSLTFAGVVSGDDRTRFLTRSSGSAAERNLRRNGYRIERTLAGGRVLIVSAADDADEVASAEDVAGAVPDFRFEIESPAYQEHHADLEDDSNGNGGGNGNGNGNGNGRGSTDDTSGETGPAHFADQWDKQVTEVRPAHDVATGAGTRLAVIDTGVDHTHPDLGNVNTDPSVSIIDGEITDHVGDVGEHGTHVAGTVAATGTEGVLGTAPDAELVSIRVFGDEGAATFGDILTAIDYAASIDADGANMSIGTVPIPPAANADQYRRMMEPVAQHATSRGTVLVGSAGNDGANLQQGGFFTMPNSLAGVMSTSATGPNDERSFYSNYGTNEIDTGAPGGGYETEEKTLSEDPTEVDWPFPLNLVLSTVPDGWAWMAGTSMAAPQVTGLVGIVRELDPDASTGRVTKIIKAGCDGDDGKSDPDVAAGRVNAWGCVEQME